MSYFQNLILICLSLAFFAVILFTKPVLADDNCTNDNVHIFELGDLENSIQKINNLDLEYVDIFVPGTNAEKGCIRQFNSLIVDASSYTYITINYYDPDLRFWGLQKQKRQDRGNAALYDDSVKKGAEALKELLETIKKKNPHKVRVFGHSKGSHIVSYVSREYNNEENREIKFWAFAQPGRTDKLTDYEGILGDPGYIQKVSENLVTITWENDEVIHFKEDGKPPNAWKYPGEVNKPHRTGTKDLNRIDHHDNYGGDYEKDTCPYYATGNDSLYNAKNTHLGQSTNTLGCDEHKDVKFHAYFWGNSSCRSIAFEANEIREVGYSQKIGTSGPRGDNCQEHAKIPVSFKMEYFIKAKNNNIAGFHVRFREYTGNGDESPNIVKLGTYRREESFHKNWLGLVTKRESAQSNWIETDWVTKDVPLSFRVQIDPMHSKVNKKRNNTIHISWLKARFTLPGEDEERKVYLIGPQWENDGVTHFEGQAEHQTLSRSRHGGWNPMPGERGNWEIYKSSKVDLGYRSHPFKKIRVEPRDTIKIVGNGEDRFRGFYKRVSLVD